jgi:hypothetical protein
MGPHFISLLADALDSATWNGTINYRDGRFVVKFRQNIYSCSPALIALSLALSVPEFSSLTMLRLICFSYVYFIKKYTL